AIYTIKSGGNTREAEILLKKAVDTLPDSARKNVIMGCTEIPLAIKGSYKNTNMINPTEILAKTAVRMSMN
ncbi:aspartate/glutamate racemase family protein, partial [candidate division KSB1 bacterium]|nr:aspartate/glutamate racemase family protein [candidate division KSB1 bacterium]